MKKTKKRKLENQVVEKQHRTIENPPIPTTPFSNPQQIKVAGSFILEKRDNSETHPANLLARSGTPPGLGKKKNAMNSEIQALRQYLPAQLSKGKIWFVYFYAFNPLTGKLERKRIKLMRIKYVRERERYARELIKRINAKLEQGWNPFIDPEQSKQFTHLSEVIDRFLVLQNRKLSEGISRPETARAYHSYLRIFHDWIKKNHGDIYVYQLTRRLISDFLDYIFLDLARSAQTRNNYLDFLRVFAHWLQEKEYISWDPTAGIRPLPREEKQRTIIDPTTMHRIEEYLTGYDRYFLLACYLEYFCFVRPKELSYIKIEDFSVKDQTLRLHAEYTKNRKDALIFVPQKVLRLMLDLHIFDSPGDWYLFSYEMMPGKRWRSEKQFRDRWNRMRKKLGFPDTYKFYSLKDTGITRLLEKTGNPRLVRNQARHSSIAITDIYVDRKEIPRIEVDWDFQ